MQNKHKIYENLYFRLLDELPEKYATLTGLFRERPNTIFDPINPKAFEHFENPHEIAENPFYYKHYIIYFDEAQAEPRTALIKDMKQFIKGGLILLHTL